MWEKRFGKSLPGSKQAYFAHDYESTIRPFFPEKGGAPSDDWLPGRTGSTGNQRPIWTEKNDISESRTENIPNTIQLLLCLMLSRMESELPERANAFLHYMLFRSVRDESWERKGKRKEGRKEEGGWERGKGGG